MAVPTADYYTAESGATAVAFGGRSSYPFIDDLFDRSCVDVGLSSIEGPLNALLVKMYPRLQQSQFHNGGHRWVDFLARLNGMLGLEATLRTYRMATGENGTDWMWPSTRRPMLSEDGGMTWGYFPNCTINTGSQYAEYSLGRPFRSDQVLVSRSRLVSVHACGAWLANLAARFPGIVTPADSAYAYAPSSDVASYRAQAFIANEYLSQTDERGRTSGKTPLYAARINHPLLSPVGGGAKRKAFICAGVHAGEDLAEWHMRAFLEWLLGGSDDAIAVLREVDIMLYPLVNAPGRYLGGYRGLWTVYSGGRDDINRNMDTNGIMEPVDKFKAAITLDRAGQVPIFGIDFHGTGQYLDGFVQDAGDTYHSTFKSQMVARTGGLSYSDEADTLNGHVAGYIKSLGTLLHVTLEIGDVSPISIAGLQLRARALVGTLRYFLDNGIIT